MLPKKRATHILQSEANHPELRAEGSSQVQGALDYTATNNTILIHHSKQRS
jgi:hypothetical protein